MMYPQVRFDSAVSGCRSPKIEAIFDPRTVIFGCPDPAARTRAPSAHLSGLRPAQSVHLCPSAVVGDPGSGRVGFSYTSRVIPGFSGNGLIRCVRGARVVSWRGFSGGNSGMWLTRPFGHCALHRSPDRFPSVLRSSRMTFRWVNN